MCLNGTYNVWKQQGKDHVWITDLTLDLEHCLFYNNKMSCLT